MRRYRSAIYNHRVGRTSTVPPTREAFVRAIEFIEPVVEWQEVVPAVRDERLAIAVVATVLNRDAAFLSRLSEDSETFLSMRWSDWQESVFAIVVSVSRAWTVLASFSGLEVK
jgi:hypothetical protein